ncbi:methionyl-tRNA synthetase [Hyaloraphidium curvatum]|nr:methionyl-tRNA synthetase [Hyaloraphidium curvatum]
MAKGKQPAAEPAAVPSESLVVVGVADSDGPSAASPSPALLKLHLAVRLAGADFSAAAKPLPKEAAVWRTSAFLELPNGQPAIYVANTAVKYLLGKSADPARQAVTDSWAEWEETTLAPVAGPSGGDKLDQALKTVESEVLPLFPDHPALEAIFFGTLSSLDLSRHPKLAEWKNTFAEKPQAIEAVAAVGGKTLVSSIPRKLREGIDIPLDHHDRVILPEKGKRNVLITSALPYVNNVPHLGNIIGSVLSADVFARYCRLRGYNTLYICGTDEYGTATETKALEEGVTPQELCDKYHKLHVQTYTWFGIDFDYFGRTTTPWQTTICQDIFLKAHGNKYTIEDTMVQLWCDKHSGFLADRFVEGTCPNCGYNDARGDQCDSCQKLLNAVELIDPRCKLDGYTPVQKSSRHLFLNLPELQSWNEEWIADVTDRGRWSSNGKAITQSWLAAGLTPRCITRDLKWGVPVPLDGFREKVFYVWFDAPIGYLSITANYTEEWEQWWKNPEHVELFQFMGKDNVPFHSVIFPCSLKASGDPYTMVFSISTCEYLQYESGKFSKSRGVGVFGNNVMESGIPVEVWRYYLLSNRPETADSQFLWKDFIQRNNGELLANLGNYVNRVVRFLDAKYGAVVPAADPQELKEAVHGAFLDDVNALLAQYVEAMENRRERQGLSIAMSISARGNQYLQENKLDNNLFANRRATCDTVLSLGLNLCYLLSALFYPFMPTTSESILRQVNAPARRIEDWSTGHRWTADDILGGHRIGKAEYLFSKIDEAKEEELRSKYGGKQGAPAQAAEPASDAKKGKKAAKKEAPANGPAPASNLAPEEVARLDAAIKEQGDKVRQLKTEKADAALVKVEVDKLLALKKELGGK